MKISEIKKSCEIVPLMLHVIKPVCDYIKNMQKTKTQSYCSINLYNFKFKFISILFDTSYNKKARARPEPNFWSKTGCLMGIICRNMTSLFCYFSWEFFWLRMRKTCHLLTQKFQITFCFVIETASTFNIFNIMGISSKSGTKKLVSGKNGKASVRRRRRAKNSPTHPL